VNLACVIVTYNRLEKLKRTLDAYTKQIRQPDYLIVVNNCSSDGTEEYLNIWKQKQITMKVIVMNIHENLGGSGGFYMGSQKALTLGVDWVWFSDDDAYPEPDALDILEKSLEDLRKDEKVVAVCSSVWEDGRISLYHRKRCQVGLWKFKQFSVPEVEYNQKNFELQLFSYVGVVIKAKILGKVGLCEKDYFIYWDDTEHSYRISKIGKILCLPAVKVNHDVKPGAIDENVIVVDWRFYYMERNYYAFLKKHFPIAYRLQWSREYLKARLHLLTGP
jgi:GT2 family glycosyltransferase